MQFRGLPHYGSTTLGEITMTELERCFIGHVCEIASTDLAVEQLRSENERWAPALLAQGRKCLEEWLASVESWPLSGSPAGLSETPRPIVSPSPISEMVSLLVPPDARIAYLTSND